MFIVCVELKIKTGMLGRFMPLMEANADATLRLEANCVQFDICTLSKDVSQILLYEVYTNEEAFADHLKSQHFKHFDQETQDMIVSKTVRTGTRLHPA